ncbi:MAG: type I DNA topoisomerase [Synergistaceae bacterium]
MTETKSTKKVLEVKDKVKKVTKPKKQRTKKFGEYEGKTLVIVESPAKAKTLEKILGRKYKVLASVGHVRDLPKGRIAVDIENDFEPDYIQVRGKAELVKGLKGASAVAKETLLASDPDREGEAISWHLANMLGIDVSSECRIRMHEITKSAVQKAVASPDKIDMNRVNAQQARRVLDRLVGYQLSPLLWYKVQRGLSAGRVQSVALRIVCEREEEIERFIPEEYWLIDVKALSKDKKREYLLRLEKYKGAPVDISNITQAKTIVEELESSELKVTEFKSKTTFKSSLPPFKTSTLQQEASRRCGFAPKRTMRIAQSLYEGIEIPGRGPTGLITYMRTDSLRLSPEAIDVARLFIKDKYGDKYLPAGPNQFVAKEKSQDAHEAIRATDVNIIPSSIKEYLTAEQYKLYDLIWSRYVATQMSDAEISRTSLLCTSGECLLKQAGVVVVFDGWGKLYPLGIKDISIPTAKEGEILFPDEIKKEQKFTMPPSRYTEAGLVKALEEKAIGRPSTYATIIDTLFLRGYTTKDEENKKLQPTSLGRLVSTFLVRYFSEFINVDFTAKMEEELDQIEIGELIWRNVVSDFWGEFKPILDNVSEKAEDMHPEPVKIGEPCPECGNDLIIKTGRFGEFIACSGYPDCKYTRKIVKTTGIKCPKCKQGELIRRKSAKGKAKGRFFYGCERYPECDYVSWKKPEEENKSLIEVENSDI